MWVPVVSSVSLARPMSVQCRERSDKHFPCIPSHFSQHHRSVASFENGESLFSIPRHYIKKWNIWPTLFNSLSTHYSTDLHQMQISCSFSVYNGDLNETDLWSRQCAWQPRMYKLCIVVECWNDIRISSQIFLFSFMNTSVILTVSPFRGTEGRTVVCFQ
jgi:hypothetical protein